MAHHAQGHTDDGQRWLDTAIQWIDDTIQQQASGGKVDPYFTWNHQIELWSLRGEAAALFSK